MGLDPVGLGRLGYLDVGLHGLLVGKDSPMQKYGASRRSPRMAFSWS